MPRRAEGGPPAAQGGGVDERGGVERIRTADGAGPVAARRLQHCGAGQPHGIGETAVGRRPQRRGLRAGTRPDRARGVGALVLAEFPLPGHHPQRVSRARLQGQVHVALRGGLLQADVQTRVLSGRLPHRIVEHDPTAGVRSQQCARQQRGQSAQIPAPQRAGPHQQPGLGQDPPQQGQVQVGTRFRWHRQQDRLLCARAGGGEAEGGGGRDGAVHVAVRRPAARAGSPATGRAPLSPRWPGRRRPARGPPSTPGPHRAGRRPLAPAGRSSRRPPEGVAVTRGPRTFVELGQERAAPGRRSAATASASGAGSSGAGMARSDEHRDDDRVAVVTTDRGKSAQRSHRVRRRPREGTARGSQRRFP